MNNPLVSHSTLPAQPATPVLGFLALAGRMRMCCWGILQTLVNALIGHTNVWTRAIAVNQSMLQAAVHQALLQGFREYDLAYFHY